MLSTSRLLTTAACIAAPQVQRHGSCTEHQALAHTPVTTQEAPAEPQAPAPASAAITVAPGWSWCAPP